MALTLTLRNDDGHCPNDDAVNMPAGQCIRTNDGDRVWIQANDGRHIRANGDDVRAYVVRIVVSLRDYVNGHLLTPERLFYVRPIPWRDSIIGPFATACLGNIWH